MDKGLPLSESELKLLGALIRHKIRFMVVGLSAAALQGAPVVTEDVDLWFEDLSDPRLAKALQSIGAAYVPPFGLNPPMLAGAGSAPFDVVLRMDGLGPFRDELKNTKQIQVGPVKLKVLSLERILASKLAADREKDKRSIPALRNALRALKASLRQHPKVKRNQVRSKRSRKR